MIRWIPVIVEIALVVYCLIDCIQTASPRIRNLPRWAWIMLILFIPFVGAIAWLVAGRPLRGMPTTTAQAGPVGPDDDPVFLDELRRETEQRKRLENWEDDLKRREDEFGKGDVFPGDGAGEQPPNSN